MLLNEVPVNVLVYLCHYPRPLSMLHTHKTSVEQLRTGVEQLPTGVEQVRTGVVKIML